MYCMHIIVHNYNKYPAQRVHIMRTLNNQDIVWTVDI